MNTEEHLKFLDEHSESAGDGRWFENLTVQVGPEIRDWDLKGCWHWEEWPERSAVLPGSRADDDGIDAVGQRRDGAWVAIQCKAKGRDEHGKRYSLTREDIDKFIVASNKQVWAERWIVTNGQESATVEQLTGPLQDAGIKVVDIHRALRNELEGRKSTSAEDPRTRMQSEAVTLITRRLEKIRGIPHEEWKADEARGYVVMPCGTGKTRVGFLVTTDLTGGRGLVVVLAPSIGLVAQLRRAWLSMGDETDLEMNILAVCSDATAGRRVRGRDEENASLEQDPTLDRSHVSDRHVTGRVARNSDEVRRWLDETRNKTELRVIVSTYQSGHQTAAGMQEAGERADVMIGDEAHRTAGIRRVQGKDRAQRLRQFTMCHDSEAFPAKTRLYMTATPRVYSLDKKIDDRRWEVRTMDDERTFGVECYRLSYTRAVNEGLLSDYRIIALSMPASAYEPANQIAEARNRRHREEGKAETATTSLALRKLAYGLAVAGGVPAQEGGEAVSLHSSIAFCNRIDHSKEMAEELASRHAQDWIAQQMTEQGQTPKPFLIEHRDAGHGSHAREEALSRLAQAEPERPYGISNVGIFGEGTDSPGLTAVAFIEPRKSPVDVIQAVGRAMRRHEGKALGYIIVPILIPPGRHAETWLETSTSNEGWSELGQILNALRAHDERIETKLAELMQIYLPAEPEVADHLVTILTVDGQTTYVFRGAADDIEPALVPKGRNTDNATTALRAVGEVREITEEDRLQEIPRSAHAIDDRRPKQRRMGSVKVPDGEEWERDREGYRPGPVIREAQEALREAVHTPKKAKVTMRPPTRKQRKATPAPVNAGLRLLSGLDEANESGHRVVLNILESSGLTTGPKRDMNILQNTVTAAAELLRGDDLEEPLKRQLGMERLRPTEKGKTRADACTVTALLITNAALMHVRLARGGAIRELGKTGVANIAASSHPAEALMTAWNVILGKDYQPVFERARDLLVFVTREERKTAALGAAIRRIAKDAELIADTYAEMGMDHAGELFNKVMGDQRSDGAYFTRPLAATMLSEMALHATGEDGWNDLATYNRMRMFDPTCGSGTLLVAWLSGLKRRYRVSGADESQMQQFHRKGVEYWVAGLDINEVSLQLAGAQLSLGDTRVRYRRMELHKMPYGDQDSSGSQPALAGTLELLTDSRIIESNDPEQVQLDLRHVGGRSKRIAVVASEQEGLDDLIEVIHRRRVALMNPPFIARTKLGERFSEPERNRIRQRIDGIQELLEKTHPAMRGITDRNSTRPLYVALGLKAIDPQCGVLGMVCPTAALTAPSGRKERRMIARDVHVRWVITCHEPGNTHMSQATGINESLVIATKDRSAIDEGAHFVSLDRWPETETEAIARCEAIANGEDIQDGERTIVTQERMEHGDWSTCGWRNGRLAQAAAMLDESEALTRLEEWKEEGEPVEVHATGQSLRGRFRRATAGERHTLAIVKSKAGEGENAQRHLKARPDERWTAKSRNTAREEMQRMAAKAGHLLVTATQRTDSGRLTAIYAKEAVVGNAWTPVAGLQRKEAKALAVWMNSTIGRVLLLRVRGKSLTFPVYSAREIRGLKVPARRGGAWIERLAKVYEETKDKEVPRYDAGECEVRTAWDDAVASEAHSMGLNVDINQLRRWLNEEPAVTGRHHREAEAHMDMTKAA